MVTPHMRVYEDRVEFYDKDGLVDVIDEGSPSPEARLRYEQIQNMLEDGYLRDQIEIVRETGLDALDQSVVETDAFDRGQDLIDEMVDSITSEKGRAIVGLTGTQLSIKSIAPEQSIRLHKGSKNSNHFSWREGLSMRTIDSNYIASTLREEELLRINPDGVMMTRSLAENYPYSRWYKANLRGPQDEWGELIELLESFDDRNLTEALLRYYLLSLHNRGMEAAEIHERALNAAENVVAQTPTADEVQDLIWRHVQTSQHSARIYEVMLHSLYQVLDEKNALDGRLKHLPQMRTANKKHGNVGDLEIVDVDDEFHIHEAWDAKYERGDLEQDIRGLRGKLRDHPETEVAGFVTTTAVILDNNADAARESVESAFDVEIPVVAYGDFCAEAFDRAERQGATPADWLTAYTETLTHRRREIAPIDEPTQKWVESLTELLKQY